MDNMLALDLIIISAPAGISHRTVCEMLTKLIQSGQERKRGAHDKM